MTCNHNRSHNQFYRFRRLLLRLN